MDDGPFRYHLELTPEQLKITHTALSSLRDDFGHDQPDIVGIIQDILSKLPDEHAIRAIRIGEGSATVLELDAQRDPEDDPSAA